MRPFLSAALLAAFLLVLPGSLRAGDAETEPNPEAEESFFLGNGLLSEGDPTGALEAYEEALTLDPGFYRVHLYRARAFLALNNTDLAREAADQFAESAKDSEEKEDLAKLLARIAAFEKAESEAAQSTARPERSQRSSSASQSPAPATGDIALGVSAAVAVGGWATAGISGAVLAGLRETAFNQTVAFGERQRAQQDGQSLVPVVVGAVVVGGVATAITAALGISKATREKGVAFGPGPTLGPGLSLTFRPAPHRQAAR